MQDLIQKNHGLPGLGVKASQGEKGDNGIGTYFGFINEFFNYNYISIDTDARVAAQVNSSSSASHSSAGSHYTGIVKEIPGKTSPYNILDVSFLDANNGEVTFVYNIPNYNKVYDYSEIKKNNRYLSNIFVKVNLQNVTSDYAVDYVDSSNNIVGKRQGVDVAFFYKSKPNEIQHYDKSQYLSEQEVAKFPLSQREDFSSLDLSTYIRTASIEYSDTNDNVWTDENGNSYFYGPETLDLVDDIYTDLRKDYLGLKKKSEYNVKISKGNTLDVAVPTTLKPDFKEGDVLYFYVDNTQFHIDHQFKFMVVMTKELEGASYSDFIDAIIQQNPFNFSNFYSVGESTTLTNKNLEFINYGSSSSLTKRFAKNISAQSLTKAKFSAIDLNTNSSLVHLANVSKNTPYTLDTLFKQNEFVLSSKESKIRFSNLFLKNNAVTNVELSEVVNPENIIFNNGYVFTSSQADFDINKIAFRIRKDEFLKSLNEESDYSFGAIQIDKETHKVEDLVEEDNWICLNIDSQEKDYNLEFIPYVQNKNGFKFYGLGASVSFSAKFFNNSLVATNLNVEEKTYSSDEAEILETPIEYVFDNQITAEKNSVNLQIRVENEYVNDCSIKDIYINGQKVNINSSYNTNSNWFVFNETSASNKNIRASIDFYDNLPSFEDNDSNDRTIQEYIKTCNDSVISNISNNVPISTASRKFLITTVYSYKNQDNKVSNYWVIQPGFNDPRVKPIVSLDAQTSQLDLEKSNDVDNGVLCNQLQYYINIGFDNFNEETWCKYVDTPEDCTISVQIESLSNDLELVNYSYSISDGTRPNVKLVTDEEDNYISIDASVVTNEIDASVLKPAEKSIVTSSYALSSMKVAEVNQTLDYEGNFLVNSSSASIFSEPDKRYSGLSKNFKINLDNLSLSDIQNNNYKIRVLFEIANPVPAEIYVNFAVTGIKISYKDSSVFEFDSSKLQQEITLNDGKKYKKYIYSTEPQEFFVNPVSMVVAPEDIEKDQGIYPIKGNVKLYGSSELTSIKAELYNKDSIQELQSNYSSDSDVTTISDENINWNAWNLKLKFLQDNIRYFSISAIDPIQEMRLSNKKIFKEELEETKSSKYDDNSFLGLVYNANIMHAKNYNDKFQFYYNDELFNANKFNQYSANSPSFFNFDLNFEVRSENLLSSIETWNYEYESLPTKNNLEKVFKGFMSKYGNGYTVLDDSNDQNQYDNIISLKETKEQNEKLLLDNIILFNIHEQENESQNQLTSLETFRTLLYDAFIQYPVYKDSKVYPYEVKSPLEIIKKNLFNELLSKTEDEVQHLDDGTDKIVKTKEEIALEKLNVTLHSSYSEINTSDIIPYNLMFTIYPRVLDNTDFNVKNIFMLRKPTIQNNENENLSKHYFDVIDSQSTHLIPPYND